MKLKLFFFSLTILFMTGQFVNAQFCDNFGENDFMDLCVEQMGDGTTGPMMSTPLDIYDANTAAAGADGVDDVQITIEAVVCNSSCGQGGPYNIGGCIGGTGALGTSSDFAAAFNNGNGENTCINAGGYVCYTIDFLNGFSTTAADFDLGQSSNNGSSEGYEGTFGWVTAGTDANGAPLTGLPVVNLGNFCNYTSTDYATTQMSTFLGVTGPGTWQTDAQNTLVNNTGTQASDANGQNICGTTTSESGEDTASGTGPDQGTSAAAANPNLGLAATDIITQVKYIYFYSSTPSIDCDGDGLTAANSNPSGSWTGVDFCFDPPCMYEGEVSTLENCGEFTIDVTNIVAGGSATGTYDILVNGAAVLTGVTGAMQTGIGPYPADGATVYMVQIQETGNTACVLDLEITAPVGNVPSCGTFPANEPGVDPSLPDNTNP